MSGRRGRLRAALARQGLFVGLLEALLIAAVAVIVVLALGEDRKRPLERAARTGDVASSRPFVTAQDLAAVQDQSGKAFLRWWQLIQFQAPLSEIHAYFARSADVGARTLRRQLTVLRYLFQEAEPEVVQVEQSGSSASVLVVIARRPLLPSGERGQEQHSAEYFQLVREGSRWKLANNTYLNRLAAAEAAARSQRGI